MKSKTAKQSSHNIPTSTRHIEASIVTLRSGCTGSTSEAYLFPINSRTFMENGIHNKPWTPWNGAQFNTSHSCRRFVTGRQEHIPTPFQGICETITVQ